MGSKESTNRQSNIELLRIIAILMVICSHCIVHSDINRESTYFFNTLTSNMLILGCIANHIFLLITGFFLVKSNITYKKIIPLILEMFFYAIIFSFLNLFLFKSDLNTKSIIKGFLPIFWGNWFIRYYIILYLLAPFLNMLLVKLSREDYIKMIFFLILMVYFIATLTKNSLGFSNHGIFVVDYIIGAFISLHKIFNKDKAFIIKIGIIISSVLLILSVFCIYLFKNLLNDKIPLGYFYKNNYSILTLSLAFFIFLFAKSLHVEYNKIINKVASSTLGIYLIHENTFISPIIWFKIFPATDYYDKVWFLVFVLLKVLAVFLICLLIDQLRILLFKKAETKLSDVIYEKITSFSKNVTNILKRKT